MPSLWHAAKWRRTYSHSHSHGTQQPEEGCQQRSKPCASFGAPHRQAPLQRQTAMAMSQETNAGCARLLRDIHMINGDVSALLEIQPRVG